MLSVNYSYNDTFLGIWVWESGAGLGRLQRASNAGGPHAW